MPVLNPFNILTTIPREPICSEDMFTMWYYPSEGYFTDANGFMIPNIYQYITPGIMSIFLYQNESMIVETMPGVYVTLEYPISESDLDYCQFNY